MSRNISIILIGLSSILLGAYLENIPVNLQQPDGTKLSCIVTGDEYYVRLHDENNFTIIQNKEDGYYYYAQFINDEVIPTIFRADQPVPPDVHLGRGIQISKEDYLKRRNNKSKGRGRDAPTIGTINNINIFI